MVLAVTEPSGQYQYPAEVKFEIRQNVKADYARAAEFVNYSRVRLVSMQHEYGIFGGDDGGYILDFVRALRVPAIVTLHTVLKQPVRQSSGDRAQDAGRRRAARGDEPGRQGSCSRARTASATARCGSSRTAFPSWIANPIKQALKAQFGVAAAPHAADVRLAEPEQRHRDRDSRAAGGGPRLSRSHLLRGGRHPSRRSCGETARPIERCSSARPRSSACASTSCFAASSSRPTSCVQYLQAADIFVSPYLNEAQVTSGALSYAMGAGAAVVSTPYWHAQELLAGRPRPPVPVQGSRGA